jgi:superfamily I DNA/RNA helicase
VTDAQHPLLVGLNGNQCEVATAASHCLALAGPGSGKTKTMAVRAQYILATYPKAKVLAVTFSAEGAAELRHRINSGLSEAHQKSVAVSTFHAACGGLVARLSKANKTKRRPIASGATTYAYAMRALQRISDRGITTSLAGKEVMEAIDAGRFSPHLSSPAVKALVAAYESIKEDDGKSDFFDLIRDAVLALESGAVAPYSCTHLLLDESQDTDSWQFRFVYAQIRAGAITTVVGDDDQCIFVWRNAMGYRGMQEFVKNTGAKTVVLGVNYRSHSEIVDCAQVLIRNNRNRHAKDITSHRGPGGHVAVRVNVYESAEEEALNIVGDVVSAAYADPSTFRMQPTFESARAAGVDMTRLKSFAILARNNVQLLEVEGALREHNAPFRRLSGKGLMDYWDAAVLVDVFRHVCSSRPVQHGLDNVMHWAGLRDSDLRAIRETSYAKATEETEPAVFDRAVDAGATPQALRTWKAVQDQLRACKGRAREKPDLVINGICIWMLHVLDHREDKAGVAAGLRVIRVIHRALLQLKGSIPERIKVLMHPSPKKEEDPGHDQKEISIGTFHSSKGLEFDSVHLIGLADGVCPNTDSPIEEERNLLYVAMTRARILNHLSFNGEGKAPSPFFMEIDRKHHYRGM